LYYLYIAFVFPEIFCEMIYYLILLVFFCLLQVPERLYQLVDRSTDGLVTADQVMEFIAGLQAIRYYYNFVHYCLIDF
jgi:hypothetical protein